MPKHIDKFIHSVRPGWGEDNQWSSCLVPSVGTMAWFSWRFWRCLPAIVARSASATFFTPTTRRKSCDCRKRKSCARSATRVIWSLSRAAASSLATSAITTRVRRLSRCTRSTHTSSPKRWRGQSPHSASFLGKGFLAKKPSAPSLFF